MRYLSVCSGIEAVSVAWQPLGWEPAMFAEIDPFCCWLLRSRYRASRPQHMPSPYDAPDRNEAKRRAAAIRNIVSLPVDGDVTNAGDFTKIGAENVGAIDLLAGGTPCQSFSVAGKRAGLDDPRGNLTIEFARLADRLRPTWLVWENVPGVLSIDDGRTFGAFLGMLVQLGYSLSWRVLDAQFFGVPQRRRRVFVVGHLGSWRASAAVLFEFAGLSGYPPPRRETRKDLAPTLSARTHGGGGLGTDFDLDGGLIGDLAFGGNNTSCPIDVSTAANACATASGRIDFETETFIVHSLPSEGFDASEDGTGRGVPLISETLSTRYGDVSDRDLPDSSAILPVAFNLRGREGGAMPEVSKSASLRASAGGSTNSYIAFSAKDHGADADEIAPTLRGMGHDASHPNGGGQLAIAFTLHGSDGTATIASSTDVAGSLRTRAPGSIENSSTTAVLQEQSAASPLPPSYGEQADSFNVSSESPNRLHAPMAVRRLTPRECERLQGFPDDYTLVEYRGKLAADGPRYRSLGNSMAVPVMRWIGERIAAVDAILRDGSGVRRRP
jgi:DNA (cytosine-5)-methyltransferase 1